LRTSSRLVAMIGVASFVVKAMRERGM